MRDAVSIATELKSRNRLLGQFRSLTFEAPHSRRDVGKFSPCIKWTVIGVSGIREVARRKHRVAMLDSRFFDHPAEQQ
jgi:hypothetical protein